MSGYARLLKWAPCLYAVSRVASNSGQGSRNQLLNTQSGTQPPPGTADLLHTLSFPARTVVKNTYIPRAAPPRRTPSPTFSDAFVPEADGNEAVGFMSRLIRSRSPLVRDGWQWDHPYRLPVRMAQAAASISARILSQVQGVCFAPSLPVELHDVVLITARHPVRRSGSFNTEDLRLVCKTWDELLKKDFWRKKWLPLRPDNASWESIGERLNLLAKDAHVIKNVKIEGRATQVMPITLEDALRACPEMADIQHCQVQRIKIGLLDSLSEILLKQILLHRQGGIRHFGFRFDDTILFLGRRSMFVRSELLLPEVRRITVDISSVREAPSPQDVHHNSAGLTSLFIAELIGREDRTDAKRVELRVFCKPQPVNGARRPQVTQAHILLAAQIYDFTRALLENVAGLKLVVSFQAPLRAQVPHNRRVLDIWGRENGISLLNT